MRRVPTKEGVAVRAIQKAGEDDEHVGHLGGVTRLTDNAAVATAIVDRLDGRGRRRPSGCWPVDEVRCRDRRPVRRRSEPDVAGERRRARDVRALDRPDRRPEPAPDGDPGRPSGPGGGVLARVPRRRRSHGRRRSRPLPRDHPAPPPGRERVHLPGVLRGHASRPTRSRRSGRSKATIRSCRAPASGGSRSSTPATDRGRRRGGRWSPTSSSACIDDVAGTIEDGVSRTDRARRRHHRGAVQRPGRGDPGGARRPASGSRGNVGTVDKFQGREGVVAIYSMASSSREDSPARHGLPLLAESARRRRSRGPRCVALLVASPTLLEAGCRTPEQMWMVDALCRFVETADRQATSRSPARAPRADAAPTILARHGRRDPRRRDPRSPPDPDRPDADGERRAREHRAHRRRHGGHGRGRRTDRDRRLERHPGGGGRPRRGGRRDPPLEVHGEPRPAQRTHARLPDLDRSGAVVAAAGVIAGSFPLFLLGTVLIGFGNSANQLSRYAAADLYDPGRRASALSLVVWGATVGAVIGPNLVAPAGTRRRGGRTAGAVGRLPHPDPVRRAGGPADVPAPATRPVRARRHVGHGRTRARDRDDVARVAASPAARPGLRSSRSSPARS